MKIKANNCQSIDFGTGSTKIRAADTSLESKQLQETRGMTNSGQVKCTRFFLSVPVFLLIAFLMIMMSGCSGEDSQNISGQVTAGGAALPGVKITMTGAVSATATTDVNGSYTFGGTQSGTVILTPSLAGYSFSPPSRTFLLLGIDLGGLNYSGYFPGRLAISSHAVYQKDDGTVWTWGSNSNGQLGDGTTTDRSIPARVNGLTGVTAVAAGSAHSVALKSDGTVWACGSELQRPIG